MQPSPTASLIMWVYHVFDDMFRRDGLSTVRNLRDQTPPFRLVEPRAWRHLILLCVAGAGIFSVSQVYLQYHPLPEPLWIGVLSPSLLDDSLTVCNAGMRRGHPRLTHMIHLSRNQSPRTRRSLAPHLEEWRRRPMSPGQLPTI